MVSGRASELERAPAAGESCGRPMALIPRRLGKDEREALWLLAESANGCTQSILMAHGLAIGMLRDLVRKGLAMADQRSMQAGLRTIEVTWLTITAEGRRVLARR